MTRKIERIIIHCTATDQDTKVENISKYWREVLGWKNPGYHLIIDKNGIITKLQDFDKPSNGARGYNATALHVSYIGGVTNTITGDTRTLAQMIALEAIIKPLHGVFPLADIIGHNEVNPHKECPCFDVREWKKQIKL